VASASSYDLNSYCEPIATGGATESINGRPPNLLYLTYEYLPTLGGVQRSVQNLANAFVRRQYGVTIVANRDAGFSYERNLPVPVLGIPIPTAFRHSATEKLRTSSRDLVNLGLLAALCVRKKVDLVHCHLVNVDTRYAVALKRMLGIKMVLTLRGGELSHWIKNWPNRRAYVRRMLEAADVVTALSRSQIEDARRLAPELPWSRAEVITNPVNPDELTRLASGGSVASHGSNSYVVFCGRLANEKRIDTLIDAYQRVINQCPHYPHDLLIAGTGSLMETLSRKARRGPGGRRIRFLGRCSYEDTLAIIREAAVLVLPSQQSEGCPNVVIEAMALGTPVIVSDHAPLRELVTHGVNGEIFPTGNSSALAQRLLDLWRNPGKLSRYSLAGKKYVLQEHGFDQVSTAYDRIYRSIVAG